MDPAFYSLIGLAVGDAVGSTYEFQAKYNLRRPVQTDMIGSHKYGDVILYPGQWTDDTSMALAMAVSLIGRVDYEPNSVMKKYLNWSRKGLYSSNGRVFDIGIQTREVLGSFQTYLTDGPNFVTPYLPESGANGSIMRLASLPMLLHKDPHMAIEFSGYSSMCTHNHGGAVDSCRYLAALIVGAIQGASKEKLLQGPFVPKGLNPDYWTTYPLCDELLEVVQSPHDEVDPPDNSGGAVLSIKAILWHLKHSDSFREGVLNIANLGGDSDTVAAIYGQVAGPLYRDKDTGIPPEWIEKLSLSSFLQAISITLCEMAKVVTVENPREQSQKFTRAQGFHQQNTPRDTTKIGENVIQASNKFRKSNYGDKDSYEFTLSSVPVQFEKPGKITIRYNHNPPTWQNVMLNVLSNYHVLANIFKNYFNPSAEQKTMFYTEKNNLTDMLPSHSLETSLVRRLTLDIVTTIENWTKEIHIYTFKVAAPRKAPASRFIDNYEGDVKKEHVLDARVHAIEEQTRQQEAANALVILQETEMNNLRNFSEYARAFMLANYMFFYLLSAPSYRVYCRCQSKLDKVRLVFRLRQILNPNVLNGDLYYKLVKLNDNLSYVKPESTCNDFALNYIHSTLKEYVDMSWITVPEESKDMESADYAMKQARNAMSLLANDMLKLENHTNVVECFTNPVQMPRSLFSPRQFLECVQTLKAKDVVYVSKDVPQLLYTNQEFYEWQQGCPEPPHQFHELSMFLNYSKVASNTVLLAGAGVHGYNKLYAETPAEKVWLVFHLQLQKMLVKKIQKCPGVCFNL